MVFVPKIEDVTPDLFEYDWPPRILLRFQSGSTPDISAIKEFEYALGFSALLDHIALTISEGKWEVTIYMHQPLAKRYIEGEDYYRIHIRYRGTMLDLVDQGSDWRLWEIRRLLPEGLQHAFIVQLNPASPGSRVRVLSAGKYGVDSTTVEKLAGFTGALGVINGGYFANKSPLGMLIVNGEVLSAPMLSRPVFALDENGLPFIGHASPLCRISIGGNRYETIDTINDYYHSGPVILTADHPVRIRGNMSGRKVVIVNDKVTEITDEEIDDFSGKVIIWDPHGESNFVRDASIGDKVEYEFSLTGLPFVPRWAVQAGPMLVDNGRVLDDFSVGSFKNDIISGRSPRTAVGIASNGELLLFVGEGRLAMYSLGFTLREAAQMLLETGAHVAMNLDGGGSSALFFKGRYYGDSPTGARKSIPDAIAFGPFPDWSKDDIIF